MASAVFPGLQQYASDLHSEANLREILGVWHLSTDIYQLSTDICTFPVSKVLKTYLCQINEYFQ